MLCFTNLFDTRCKQTSNALGIKLPDCLKINIFLIVRWIITFPVAVVFLPLIKVHLVHLQEEKHRLKLSVRVIKLSETAHLLFTTYLQPWKIRNLQNYSMSFCPLLLICLLCVFIQFIKLLLFRNKYFVMVCLLNLTGKMQIRLTLTNFKELHNK
jgi:hypothetical protein